MKLTPIQKRAARKARNQSGLDMNLVALIDIFTILIFFLMSSTGIEVLSNARAVKLPISTAEKTPRQTIVVADGSKIGRAALAQMAPIQEIDVLITDESADAAELGRLRALGVEVVVV